VTEGTASSPIRRHCRRVITGNTTMRAYLRAVAIIIGLLGTYVAMVPLLT
jgi:hypothetical protein